MKNQEQGGKSTSRAPVQKKGDLRKSREGRIHLDLPPGGQFPQAQNKVIPGSLA